MHIHEMHFSKGVEDQTDNFTYLPPGKRDLKNNRQTDETETDFGFSEELSEPVKLITGLCFLF